MEVTIKCDDSMWRKFEATLRYYGEDEKTVLEREMRKYVEKLYDDKEFREAFEKKITPKERRKMFKTWLGSDNVINEWGGVRKPYSEKTITVYASVLANACIDPVLSEIPVNNLFEIDSYRDFLAIEQKIKDLIRPMKHSRKRSLLVAAMNRYKEFLRGSRGVAVWF